MVASLGGIRFDQVYGDNSGGAEFDTDGDGTATQEDEFVSFTNTTGSPIDVSGWQVWSDATGAGAPDGAQDGLYHTFPPGTVIQPGKTLYIINEISGAEQAWQQESSEGGVETGAGGANSNYLTEGEVGAATESIALVNPATGDFIVFNMSSSPEQVSSLSGFPGTTKVGEVDGASVQDDQNAGSSYQYDEGTGTYTYSAVFVPCFAAGTLIATPNGDVAVEKLKTGETVITLDAGPQIVHGLLHRRLSFTGATNEKAHYPIAFAPGSLGPGIPKRTLVLSPQHRVLVSDASGGQALVPAKCLLDRPGTRIVTGLRGIHYLQVILMRHEVLLSEGAPTESFYLGNYAARTMARGTLARIHSMGGHQPDRPRAARPLLRPGQWRRARIGHWTPAVAP